MRTFKKLELARLVTALKSDLQIDPLKYGKVMLHYFTRRHAHLAYAFLRGHDYRRTEPTSRTMSKFQFDTFVGSLAEAVVHYAPERLEIVGLSKDAAPSYLAKDDEAVATWLTVQFLKPEIMTWLTAPENADRKARREEKQAKSKSLWLAQRQTILDGWRAKYPKASR